MKKLVFVLFIVTTIFCTLDSTAQIISYPIHSTLIGVGQESFDIDSNGQADFQFEIISLSPGVLAARVQTYSNSSVLDNSTFGYPDSLNENDSVKGFFNLGNFVLGTFTNAGQFNGYGDKYLGIKLNTNSTANFGWVKINLSTNRDTLKIISCGYNAAPNGKILAGQTINTGLISTVHVNAHMVIYPNPSSEQIKIELPLNGIAYYEIYSNIGQLMACNQLKESIDISKFSAGIYTIKIKQGGNTFCQRFEVNQR